MASDDGQMGVVQRGGKRGGPRRSTGKGNCNQDVVCKGKKKLFSIKI